MSHGSFITWAAGRTDAMGLPFSDWLVALLDGNGRAVRDAHQRVAFVTQAEWSAMQAPQVQPPAARVAGQLELFA